LIEEEGRVFDRETSDKKTLPNKTLHRTVISLRALPPVSLSVDNITAKSIPKNDVVLTAKGTISAF